MKWVPLGRICARWDHVVLRLSKSNSFTDWLNDSPCAADRLTTWLTQSLTHHSRIRLPENEIHRLFLFSWKIDYNNIYRERLRDSENIIWDGCFLNYGIRSLFNRVKICVYMWIHYLLNKIRNSCRKLNFIINVINQT